MMRKTRKKAGFIADNKYLSLQIFENEKEEEEEELFLVESIEKFHDFFFAFKSVAVIVVELSSKTRRLNHLCPSCNSLSNTLSVYTNNLS